MWSVYLSACASLAGEMTQDTREKEETTVPPKPVLDIARAVPQALRRRTRNGRKRRRGRLDLFVRMGTEYSIMDVSATTQVFVGALLSWGSRSSTRCRCPRL